jgi:tricorn protease
LVFDKNLNFLPVMKNFIATLLFVFCAMLLAQANDSDPFVRFPDISPDGSMIAFQYQGDIWKVPAEGGTAIRLTVHEGYDAYPKWNNDGSRIAFSGERYGNFDIFITSDGGGFPKQLTHHSAGDYVSGWTPDGNLLFNTRRTFATVEREQEIYQIAADGGTPFRALDALGFNPAYSPDMKFMTFVRGTCKIEREDYRGPANRSLWLYNTQNDRYIQLTNFDGNEFMPVWAGNNRIFFISPKSGRYNIWQLKIDSDGNPLSEKQITFFEDDGVRWFSADGTGEQIVFERQTAIFRLNTSTGNSEKINIRVSPDYRFDPFEFKTYQDKISEYTISPNGNYAAMVIRGEVFITATNDKSRTVTITDTPWRERNVQWLNDSVLLFTSDRHGQYDLFMVRSSDPAQGDLFRTLKRETIRVTATDQDETSITISPDGKKIAFLRGAGHLITADISPDGKLSKEKTLLAGWANPGGLAWSPDSRWLAYSLTDLYANGEIYIHAADKSMEPVNISMHPRGDYSPVWSKDGSKLGFISNRNNGDADLWFVWLRKADWEKTNQDWEELDDVKTETKGDSGKKGKKDKEIQPIEIDFDRIYERLQQVTALPGNESDIEISDDGETFFFVTNRNSRQSYRAENDLFSIKWNGKDQKQLTRGDQKPYAVSLSPEGKDIYMLRSGGRLFKMGVGKEKADAVPFAAAMKIDYQAEKEQIFEEAWRSLDQYFYDPQFHGQDWDKLKAHYKPWAMKASTYYDFRDMTNFMLGQLNASHMDLRGGSGRYETQKISTGLPGIEVMPHPKGVKITDVILNSPADKTDAKLQIGEVILSVNGVAVLEATNFWSLLSNQANQLILLEVEGEKGSVREIVIRPQSNLRSELYDHWVEQRRKLTEEYSGGRLGYLHIRGMDWGSFERFERELAAAAQGKEGIVIDVRFNGGGWTTDYLMALLNVDQHAYTIPRGAAENLLNDHPNFTNYYPFGERLPFYAWNRPSIALCNESSYSNAEIFSHAYKSLGIGTLVGIPTFGAVISTGSNGLLDGSYIRLPSRAWFVKATGENMENGPAVPDIIIENTPDSKAKNRDEQLKRSVDMLLQQIDSRD